MFGFYILSKIFFANMKRGAYFVEIIGFRGIISGGCQGCLSATRRRYAVVSS